MEALEKFERRLSLVRDRVGNVANRRHTAVHLTGRPGTSKTYTVMRTLEELDALHEYRNARMSAMGLFDLLEEFPDHVIVLDDISSLFKDRAAIQILMAAMGGDPGRPRPITYRISGSDRVTYFAGGIVAISNLKLGHDPLASAIASRVTILEHDPTDEEIEAFMWHLANDGIGGLSVEEGCEIVGYIVNESRCMSRRLDLRHLDHAVKDYAAWKSAETENHWHDLVRSSMTRIDMEVAKPLRKREELSLQREKVQEAIKLFPNDVPAQHKHTGLSRATFFRRKQEVTA